MTKTIKYKGLEIPEDILPILKQAKKVWIERDQKAWEFAELAYEIVGRYIPDLTRLLAREMGVDSVSTPEGYAKAWMLFIHMQNFGHQKPFENLFISHYITVGKAFSARLRDCEGNSQKEYQEILWAERILIDASNYCWSVEKLRSRLKQEPGAIEDSWKNSAYRMIDDIDAHIINAPRLGVNELRSSVATRVARLFINVLKWAVNEEVKTPGVQRDDLKSLAEEICPDAS